MLERLSVAFGRALLITIAFLIVLHPASAAPVSGTLLMTPDNAVTVTPGVIDFSNPFSTNGTGSGTFSILNGSTGTFAPLVGQSGTIQDINNGNVPGGPNSHTVPVGVPVNFVNWMMMPIPSNNIRFDLTLLRAGIFSSAQCNTLPATAGQTCTPNNPGGSPFNMLNLSATQSQVSFVVEGVAYDTTTPTLRSNFVGTFSTTFSDRPFQTVLAQLAQNGFVQSSGQGNFTVTFIPEPSTFALFCSGAGLVFVSLVLRRRRAS